MPPDTAARPAHRHLPLVAAVALGGALGTGGRYAVTHLLGTTTSGWPLGTTAVNLVGALLLGALLEALARSGPDEGARRVLRVGVGTGVLGGFTTYSSLAVESADLLGGGSTAVGLAYPLLSALLGLLAAALGVVAGGALHRRRAAPADGPR